MSRHTLPTNPNSPQFVSDLVVGWDRPLGKFFVLVAGEEDEYGDCQYIVDKNFSTACGALAAARPYIQEDFDTSEVERQLDKDKWLAYPESNREVIW